MSTNRSGILAGGNWIVDHVKLIDTWPAQDSLASIVGQGDGNYFLFIAGQLHLDEEANERIRGAAQGLIAFILWGVGGFADTYVAGKVLAAHALAAPTTAGIAHDWKSIWLTPARGALAALLVFVIFFRNPRTAADAKP